MAERKPNIIYILQDHQAYFGHGLYKGGVMPKRPCFEAFADTGISFSQARCVTPMCGPARRTMLTGLYPHNHKQVHNENDPPYDDEVILDSLYENGYRNYYYGKWHAGPGDARDHHCEGFSYTSYGNPYITPEYEDYLKKNNLPPASHHVEYAFMTDSYVSQGYFPGLKAGADYSCRTGWCGEHAVGITTTPKETHEAFFLAHLAMDRLEELSRTESDRPFMLQVHFWGPHQPFFPTEEFASMYKPEDIGEYPSFRDDLKGQPDVFRMELSHPMTEDGEWIKVPSALPWSDWQKILARCYAHITMIDAAGGMIVDKVRELGLDDNTLIIWATDHGDAIASHGGHFDKNSHMSEEVMRVPYAMSWKGVIAPHQSDDHLVFTCDTAPTMMDAAGLSFRKGCDGQSLLPLARGEKCDWRNSLMCESYGHGYGCTIISRLVYKDGWKYVVTEHDLEQLYDLGNDPYEMNNLSQDPAFFPKRVELRDELRKLMKSSGDTVDPDWLISSARKTYEE